MSSIQVEWPRCSINRPQAGLFTDNFCDIFGCVVHEISILDWPRVHFFLKKTRYFGCSDADCNFVSTHALWQVVFIMKSSKRRILNYSCWHHLMWIGCRRNSQSNSLSKILPFRWNRGNLEGGWFSEKLTPPPRGSTFPKSSTFWGSDAGQGGNLVKSQLGGNFSGELFLYKTGVRMWPYSGNLKPSFGFQVSPLP